jgi:hypothetical protein
LFHIKPLNHWVSLHEMLTKKHARQKARNCAVLLRHGIFVREKQSIVDFSRWTISKATFKRPLNAAGDDGGYGG